MTSEILTRDCAPGDVLYRSKEYPGGVFFTITLLDFEPVPASEFQFDMKYCKARLELCLAIPTQDGVVTSDFELPDTTVRQILSEKLSSHWGYDNIIPGYRCRTVIRQGIDIQMEFQALQALGVEACVELENIVNDKVKLQGLIDQKRKEVLSTFKVQYKLLNTEPEQKG